LLVKYGLVALGEAKGAILAHSLKLGGQSFSKGHVLTDEDIALLAPLAGEKVAVLRLEADDVPENEAAARIAKALQGEGLETRAAFTGRANLYARAAGLFLADEAAIHGLNTIDEGLTVATLAPFARVHAGQMVATVKIIPYALPGAVIERGTAALLAQSAALLRLAPFAPKRTALILTTLPGQKPSVVAKTRSLTEARLKSLGATLEAVHEIPHTEAAIRQALEKTRAELILVAGAAAIVDRRDVVPAAILAAGGEILHFGMPVDPGNLLLLARLGTAPVLGLPGCARSPKLNGVDWVLERLMAGLSVTPQDIQSMGVGGLLMDTPLRPQRRESAPARSRRIGAVLLAAGLSRRMGTNKLLAPLGGTPLVRRCAETLVEAGLSPIRVVLGHEAEAVRAALAGLDLSFVVNPDYENGLASSLAVGIAALEADGADAALVALGDMPLVTPAQLRALMNGLLAAEEPAIVMPTFEGRQGNPVIWERVFFDELKSLVGDRGAKSLLGLHADQVVAIEMEDAAVLADADTPDALARLRERLNP
jgi:molybdenum cofactor cytidylyltransferase